MLAVSNAFSELAESAGRNIDIKLTALGCPDFDVSEIESIQVEKSVASGGLELGNCISSALRLTMRNASALRVGAWIIPSIRFLGNPNSEWLHLGKYYINSNVPSGAKNDVTAYDMMYQLDKPCTFVGNHERNIRPLSFPASMQNVLRYICNICDIDCTYTCQPFIIQYCPREYTHRQLIGYIASAHACNAFFNNLGELVFKEYTTADYSIPRNRCTAHTVTVEEPFTVKGMLFTVDSNTSIFIDDEPDSEYDESMDGVVRIFNPFASIAIAEYVWGRIGNLSYCNANIEMRGLCFLECGDVLSTIAETEPVSIIAHSIAMTIDAQNGLIESIKSLAPTSAQSANPVDEVQGGTSQATKFATKYGDNTAPVTLSAVGQELVTVAFYCEATYPVLQFTGEFTVTQAGTLEFTIIYDGNALITFKEAVTVGTHFKSFCYMLLGTLNGAHTVSVYVHSTDAYAVFPLQKSIAIVSAWGMETSTVWDGTIRLSTKISPIPLVIEESAIAISGWYGNLSAATQMPSLCNLESEIERISVASEDDIVLLGFTAGFTEGEYPYLLDVSVSDTETLVFTFNGTITNDSTILASLNAFTVQSIINNITYYYAPLSLSLSHISITGNSSLLTLETESFASASYIDVGYNANVGTLHVSGVDGHKVESFIRNIPLS